MVAERSNAQGRGQFSNSQRAVPAVIATLGGTIFYSISPRIFSARKDLNLRSDGLRWRQCFLRRNHPNFLYELHPQFLLSPRTIFFGRPRCQYFFDRL